ncbi:MAG: hypothetical protein IKO68_12685 [Oscillospiraceae bacterium]|nr:hypothetical protein [Oscillospiraceae bacterium]
METRDILNLIALIVIPILAVLIGHWCQISSEKRKDKMQIFKTLMTARIYGWTVDSVHALNIIDIVFANDRKVRAAWKDLNDKYHVTNPDESQLKKIEQAQYKLLEAIANSLGYKDKITWETIQNPYIPNGLMHQMESQKQSQQTYMNVLTGMSQMIPKNSSNKEGENHVDTE